MSIGSKIQELRKNNNLSQEALAEKLGVARQTISKWELDETSPDIKEAKELSKIFKISLDELTNNDTKEILVEKVSNTEKNSNLILKIFKLLLSFILISLILSLLVVFIIKNHNYKLYNYSNDYEYNNLVIKDTINIKNKKVDNYITFKDLKIRNDFSDYSEDKSGNTYILKKGDNVISFTKQEPLNLICINAQLDSNYCSEVFNKNRIFSGVDLLKYSINQNYDMNIFTSIYLMKEKSLMKSTLIYYFGLNTSNYTYDIYELNGNLNGILRKRKENNSYIIELNSYNGTYVIGISNQNLDYVKDLISTISFD